MIEQSLDLAEKVRQRAHHNYIHAPRLEYCLPDGRSMVVDTTPVMLMSELCGRYNILIRHDEPDEPAFLFTVRQTPSSLRSGRVEGVRYFIRMVGRGDED